ncbi:MAG: hypothetical protein HY721_32590 [Planctomycetes bacterium]|nr:hypothetical protein [Planctomycetota bacterium]
MHTACSPSWSRARAFSLLFVVLSPALESQAQIADRQVVLSLSTEEVAGGSTVTGTVTLAEPAPLRTGATVALDRDDFDVVSMPREVTVRPGGTQASFPIMTRPVGKRHEVEISAAYERTVSRRTLLVRPGRIISVSIARPRLFAGEAAEVVLSLDGPAPAQGLRASLSTEAPAALTLPSFVDVAPGAETARFTVTALAVARITRAAVTIDLLGEHTLVDVLILSSDGTDLAVTALEVTQGIQDLENSVPLIAGRTTWVRAYARAADWTRLPPPPVRAWLFARRLDPAPGTSGDWVGPIAPANPGGVVTVRAFPDRGDPQASFNFRLPSGLTDVEPSLFEDLEAELEIRVELDTEGAVAETDESNNEVTLEARFELYNDLEVTLFKVRLDINGTSYPVSDFHVFRLIDWLERAYPTRAVHYEIRELDWPPNRFPTCNQVNGVLEDIWRQDGMPRGRRYYGMVADDFDFMRGCAAGIPAVVASGPAGDGTFGWDTDGSYADWYGGHELGHAFGRFHVHGHGMDTPDNGGCGDEAGPGVYPYPGGYIGGPADDPARFYGWDIATAEVYTPDWTDVMTYCDREWLSDYSFIRILNALGGPPTPCPPIFVLCDSPWDDISHFINIHAFVIPEPIQVVIPDFFRVLDSIRPPGMPIAHPDWAAVFFDAAGAVLASYPFTPRESTDPEPDEVASQAIAETVPWHPETARIALRYRGDTVAERLVSAHAPVIRRLTPLAGLLLDGDSIDLDWEAEDADGDALVYSLLLSAGEGAAWKALASGIDATRLTVRLGLLPGCDQCRFRLRASDGIHTVDFDSDLFALPSRPPAVMILRPAAGARFRAGAAIAFSALAYDPEDGPLGAGAFEWLSDRDGALGGGASIETSALSAGPHTVSVTATDSDGDLAAAAVSIVIEPPAVEFLRGDCNDDGRVDLSDALCSLNWLFLGSPAPGCLAAADVNADRRIDISDAVAVLGYLFLGTPAPPAPFPDCGPGATAGELRCEVQPRRCRK